MSRSTRIDPITSRLLALAAFTAALVALPSCYNSGGGNAEVDETGDSSIADDALSEDAVDMPGESLDAVDAPSPDTGDGFPIDVWPWDPTDEDDSVDIQEVDYGHGIGAPCSSVEDCNEVEGDAVCLIDDYQFKGGYCTTPCMGEEDCTVGDKCILCGTCSAPNDLYCVLGCKAQEECPREGYSCNSTGTCYGGWEM